MSIVTLELETPIGNLDLSSYLNVQAGQGMDPAAPQFSDKVFSHSLLKQGGTLALEDLKLRELTFPLNLKATSKDKLTALVREINTLINTPGAEVEWSDEGTAISTFFTLASGQLDPEFDFRQGQQTNPILKAKLRLFVQPLGVAEKSPRTLLFAGTSVANGATVTGGPYLTTFRATSSLRGDAPALPNAIIGVTPSLGQQAYAAFSVLPNASYTPLLMATAVGASVAFGSANNFKATRTAAEGAFEVGYAIINDGTKPPNFYRPGSVYFGAHRVLAVARRLNPATPVSIYAEAENEFKEQVGAATEGQNVFTDRLVELKGSLWQIADLGVLNRASSQSSPWAVTLLSTGTVALAGLIMLPENTTQWLTETESKSQVIEFGEKGVVSSGINAGYVGFAPDRSGYARGQLPALAAGGSPPYLAFLSMDQREPARTFSSAVTVHEQTRYVF